ncbi:NO-inducible flavohemoprotein [Bacillus testis]|uniref:NO-inducible flavohemoprotein n=1 Tax=Bacillus testis TaxID=1622072 RepID=UPI00067F014C|nr:NO-inducible flavohemoprotein [Bacillus testis]
MLSQQTIDIVKSTAPVLEVKGTEITTAFYRNLFKSHPELLNIFNHANQEKGRQQTALANTVTAAAYYIDQLEVLLPVVKQIAHKHRSLLVAPEHYPIVGEHLLGAIKEVLGDAATDEIIQAWAEAYGAIADVFISVEKEMYDEAADQEDGWKGHKEFVIDRTVKESDIITSFYLKAADGSALPAFLPGQYVTVTVKIPGEPYTMNRQYSLTNAPGEDYYRISVKKEKIEGNPDGKVSNYLHDLAKEGDLVQLTTPAGEFTVDIASGQPITFLSAGVGITPFMSMLHTMANENPEREVHLVHASKTKNVQAFAEEIESLQDRMPNLDVAFYHDGEKETDNATTNHKYGRITGEVIAHYPKESVFYVCGPVGFMQFAVEELQSQGVSADQIHYEFFGPAMEIKEKAV